MRLNRPCALALLALLAACGRAKDDGDGAVPNGVVISPDNVATVPEAPNEAAPAPVATPSLDQLAGIRIGATLADLRAKGFTVEKDDGPDPDNRCGYARIAGLTDLFVMLDGETVVRIDVVRSGHPLLGVDIGMSETRAVQTLGPRIRVLRNLERSATSHFFVIHGKGAPFGLIFETDGAKVIAYRLGQWDAVRSSEECL